MKVQVGTIRPAGGGNRASTKVHKVQRQTEGWDKNYSMRLSVVVPHCTFHCIFGTVLDSQTDCYKTNRIRLAVVNPSVRRSTARQIVSKLIDFVCPSSTRPQSAGSVRRSTARQIVSKLIEFVCPSSTRHRSAGSVRRSTVRQIVSKLIEIEQHGDGQTNWIKFIAFVCPSHVHASPPTPPERACFFVLIAHNQVYVHNDGRELLPPLHRLLPLMLTA